jgi:hypothetical protein
MNSEIVTASGAFNNCTVSAAVAKILTYSTHFTAGSITSTAKVSLTISWESVLSALQKVLTAAYAEFDVQEVAGTISVSPTLGANNSVYVRTDKNIKSIEVTQLSRDVVNKLYGVGGGQPPATIAGARHIVNAYDSGTGVLTIDGNKVVPENDSWNTDYLVSFVSGIEKGQTFTITDCVHGTVNDTLTIGIGRTIAAGDKFTIAFNSCSHPNVNFIRAGSSITSYGEIQGAYKNGKWTDAVNLVTVPALDGTYGSGLCAGWTKEGTPTVTENTTAGFIQYGTKSQRVQGDADAEGISQVVAVTTNHYYRVNAWVYITSGTVKMTVNDGTLEYEVSKSDTGWQHFELSEKSTGSTLTIKIIQSGVGTSDFYVDAVQVTEGAMNYSFTENCDSLNLWHETFDQLMKVKDPPVQYKVTFVDLYKISPTDYPYDQISIGDTVTIYDSALNIQNVTARVKEISQDVFNPERTEHTISNI